MDKNFLGIDWGKAKVGVALGHAETKIAVAYATWAQDAKLFPYLKETVELEGIGKIILGTPAYVEAGHKDEIALFAEKLEKELGVEVISKNEMFTTKMAQANLAESKKKDLAAYDDAEAARILLQDWLEGER